MPTIVNIHVPIKVYPDFERLLKEYSPMADVVEIFRNKTRVFKCRFVSRRKLFEFIEAYNEVMKSNKDNK